MNKENLDPEERDLLNSYERGEWRPAEDLEVETKRYRELARSTFRKDARVNIRISSKDLETLKKMALDEGLPYQTLIASILHKYAAGRLVERSRSPRYQVIPEQSQHSTREGTDISEDEEQ